MPPCGQAKLRSFIFCSRRGGQGVIGEPAGDRLPLWLNTFSIFTAELRCTPLDKERIVIGFPEISIRPGGRPHEAWYADKKQIERPENAALDAVSEFVLLARHGRIGAVNDDIAQRDPAASSEAAGFYKKNSFKKITSVKCSSHQKVYAHEKPQELLWKLPAEMADDLECADQG